MTTYTHAHYDSDGKVLRLTASTEAAATGLTKAALTTPVSAWPAPPNTRSKLKFNSGALAWEDPRTTEQAWADARAQRDALLLATDFVPLRAMERSEAVSSGWLTYRQALRDITTQTDPFALTWPTKPNS